MAAVTLEELFDSSRLLHLNWTLLLLILYFPIGVVLAIVRCFALVQFYLASTYLKDSHAKRYLLRVFGTVLGVHLVEKRSPVVPDQNERAIWVCNSVTPFDRIIVRALQSSRSVVDTVFPEGAMTSGKKGLLKFRHHVLEKVWHQGSVHIQPVALSVHRPFPDEIAVTTLDSGALADTFWLLFSPVTFFVVRYADPFIKKEDETADVAIQRLEEEFSQLLGIQRTPFTHHDKEELVKRRKVDVKLNSQGPTRAARTNVESMAAQVKEVLPHVPLAAIINDLNRTGSIDLTITNFVEGLVSFTPEPDPSSVTQSEASGSTVQASTAKAPVVASSVFGKTPSERLLSLQERKKLFIDDARRRYCEKHGINVPGVN